MKYKTSYKTLKSKLTQDLTELNIILPYDLVIALLEIYPTAFKMCPHKNLQDTVYNICIHNFQELAATKVSFNRLLDK